MYVGRASGPAGGGAYNAPTPARPATTIAGWRMERSQILKVMVPVGGFGLLLLIIGGVVAMNSGGGKPTTPDQIQTPAGPVSPSKETRPPSAYPKFEFPLDGPEWKEVAGQSGLKYWDVKVGDGKECPPGATVKAQYTGWLTDGYSFDNPQKHGPAPIGFSLNGVVGGWTHGIPGMKVGGVRRLFIPSPLGYGPRGMPPSIPGNSDLVFEVELAGVN